MTHLTLEKFCDALQKGLGRAIIHVQEYGTENVRNEILHACQHNLAYDPQCEESRANWLLDLVNLAPDAEFYHQCIIDALQNSTDFWDTQQLMELAALLAQRGLKQARQAIYHKFARQQFNECWLGGYQILELDGIEGLLYVAKLIGARQLQEPDYWIDDYLVTEAIERFGEQVVITALEERAKVDANVRVYLDAIMNRRASVSPIQRPHLTLKQILSKIEAGAGSFPGIYATFGFRASNEDIEQIFVQLQDVTSREQLIRYLWVFRRRALPCLDERLLSLAENDDDQELQEAAIAALANTEASSVRALAIRLLQEQPSSIHQGAIQLFSKNYQPGDHQLIGSVLPVQAECHTLHVIGRDLLEVIKAQEDTQLTACFLWIYDRTPCSSCREAAVKAMLVRQQLPQKLLLECHWDCSTEIRAMVSSQVPT